MADSVSLQPASRGLTYRLLIGKSLQGVDPVLRTYNTLIIACNMCGQPREAMAVYRRMLDAGYAPNATTYNALISAYGKNGQLDKASAFLSLQRPSLLISVCVSLLPLQRHCRVSFNYGHTRASRGCDNKEVDSDGLLFIR